MSEPEESLAVPDSTTKEQRLGFSYGEDVLLQHEDKKFYLGTIVEVDSTRDRCLVKFADNTSSWSSVKELTKLPTPDSKVMCVLCKRSEPTTDNDIVVCDKCGRGYHQICHQPHVSKEHAAPDSHWKCKKCLDTTQLKLRDLREPMSDPKNSMIKANIRKVCSGRDQPEPPPVDRTKLPYDPNMLNWDAHHRVNAEQIYCYCGLNGEWYTQMLQCARCKQWFHEKCVSCLTHSLYSGDRFYVFVCSTCNYGKEFVRRLELKWVDLVHLMLYNLTVYNAKKYYDLDTAIVPFADVNWNSLQLPPKLRDVTTAVRRKTILDVLTNNRNRFKCGREIKKRTTIWGLRQRLPPPCPVVNLPATGVIDDSVLRRCWGANRRLQYLLPTNELANPEKSPSPIKQSVESVVIAENPSDVVMRGTVFPQNDFEQRTSPTPNPQNESTESLRERYSGGGFVKKSFPFPKLSIHRKRRFMALTGTLERMLRKQKKKEKCCTDNVTVKNQGVRDARYRKARKLLKNAIAKSKTRSPEVSDLPPTPPTSVSGPPTPPATTSAMSEPSSGDLMLPLPPSTPADTSGDDESSSRGTLDSLIPPSKDYEGKNHPFRNYSESLGTPCSLGASSSTPNSYNQCPITLPLPLTPVISQPPIVRPAKRQLSEKDIIVDRNGQVKRRRQHRRGRPSQQQQQQKQQEQQQQAQLQAQQTQFPPTASKTAAILPARSNEVKSDFVRNLRSSFNSSTSSTNSHISNCVNYALNGRRLRQRQSNDKLLPPDIPTQKHSTIATATKCSPVKQSAPDISMDDLKSSVNMYFGAANRIACGEKYFIRAKRIDSNGRMQYLIEWEGPKT